ncbi:rhodanese-like domain-containing protein [Poseidonibacter lekithochrous]|uniref:rhodanese-like domain-containing protein n=1 Tax=Poseidonibacter TaxID=2321187 RepID=UPI001C098194|nr:MULTISPECIES: rhodanese-like domain-containing protein [Poseidonibacter]MBU3015793.1 rhodanese-like domain-containing protein [Poseidonibacter lekithochrous]MDO6829093.1 rhodanese-like domain-containing protein [Poseidonibacter sp. 1_MG-2023]
MKKILIIITLLSSLIISSMAQESKSLTVDELEIYIEKNIIVIDIRAENKWKTTGTIPNSYRLEYNKKNEKKWLYTLIKLIKDKNRAFVLISKKGKKAKDLVFRLDNEKKLKNGHYLDGGIDEWINSHRKVIMNY